MIGQSGNGTGGPQPLRLAGHLEVLASFTGELSAEPGRFGMDDAGCAAAMAQAAHGQLEPGPAGACGCGRNQPGPYGRQAGQ